MAMGDTPFSEGRERKKHVAKNVGNSGLKRGTYGCRRAVYRGMAGKCGNLNYKNLQLLT